VKADQANELLSTAQSKATEMGIAVCIAILDAGGNLKAFSRMDRAWLGSIDVALKKAKTAVLFEAETQAVWEYCKPDGPAHGMELSNGGLVSFAGGLPLKTADGQLLGSIGISGGQVDQDLEVARAALAAFES
jgi:uncharacterized protein GlcG (DUF336 family)